MKFRVFCITNALTSDSFADTVRASLGREQASPSVPTLPAAGRIELGAGIDVSLPRFFFFGVAVWQNSVQACPGGNYGAKT